MSDITPTRSVAIALAEERRAMKEGYAFLDEKCLLLAGAMIRELRRHDAARSQLRTLQSQAAAALAAAIRLHGVQGLQCYPALQDAISLSVHQRFLLNVPLLDATEIRVPGEVAEPAHPSAEAESCRAVFLALTQHLVAMAALSGNLARLYREYRRSVRRVRALQDVLLPELDASMNEIETQLEELEREEVLGTRWQQTGRA